MEPSALSLDRLFEDHCADLRWNWVAGRQASGRVLDADAARAARSAADLVGYLNFLHPDRVQVLGAREVRYLAGDSASSRARRSARIQALAPPALVLCEGVPPPADLVQLCERTPVALFATPEPAARVVEVLRTYLGKHFAPETSMHGVFMDILGLGVLITGASGLGKSELGLELISRGNGLVADDVVDLQRINQSIVEGRCPELLQNMLEVRGIGLLDIRAIFGEAAVRRRLRLRLIVELVQPSQAAGTLLERLPAAPLTQDVLGVPIQKVMIEMVAGRNIAVLVEAAVRNHILQLRGIDSYQEFLARHRAAMSSGRPAD